MSEVASETKVIAIKKERPSPRVRLESVSPTHIVECWKLFDRSLRESNQPYPDRSEDSPEIIRHILFRYMSSPTFVGLIAKVGKKPVGMIIGDVRQRSFGKPRQFCFIWACWVEPEYRKLGVMKQLYQDYFYKLKKAGIFYWEAETHEELTKTLLDYKGYETKKLFDHVGGKC